MHQILQAEQPLIDVGQGTNSKRAKVTIPANIPSMEKHDDLLRYLQARLSDGQINRPTRLKRYARIDRDASTWQKLDKEDSARRSKQDSDGQSQAIHINLPLVQSHIEDSTAFYANIYSPASGGFFQLPESVTPNDKVKALVDKLNTDARTAKYFKELVKGMKSLQKYNVGGFELIWGDEQLLEGINAARGMNHILAVDLYNLIWDRTISDPALIRTEAEWAATFSVRNRKWLIKREKSTFFSGVGRAFPEPESRANGIKAKYYKHPPSEAKVSATDESGGPGGQEVNWADYGVGLEAENYADIEGHEVTHMYCWLNPYQFGMTKDDENDFQLWEFYIVDDEHIVRASPVEYVSPSDESVPIEIPLYLGYMTQDEMGSQQRSTAELLQPFQTFASFCLNAHVSGTRSSIFGIKGYDPGMFDLSEVAPGQTAAWLKSKQPGRDVRSGLHSLNGEIDTSQTMQTLAAILNLVREFFPSQALPSQIAGMDRAVQSQVAAVMQGASRKLHMNVRSIDADIMGPMTQGAFRNLTMNGPDDMQGISDDDARRILGSGLLQLNREQAEQAFRQLLFAVIQNPETSQRMDVMAMITYWSKLLNLPIEADKFQLQQAAAPEQPQQAMQVDPTAGMV